MSTTAAELEATVRAVYGPCMRQIAFSAVEAVTLLRMRLDQMNKEQAVLNEALATVERRIGDVIKVMETA